MEPREPRRLARYSAALAAMLIASAGAAPVLAQPTIQEAASIVIFPLVRVSEQYDTRLFLMNISNNLSSARCFFVNAVQSNEFVIYLTKQQPTQWLASQGRSVDPLDPSCSTEMPTCDGAGFDPGAIPPAPPSGQDFSGELICVAVDPGGHPLGSNNLVGRAVVKFLPTGDITAYNAVGLRGSDLAGETGDLLQLGPQYDGCAQVYSIQQRGIDSSDGALSGDIAHLWAVPCTQNLGLPLTQSVSVEVSATNEVESRLKASALIPYGNPAELDLLFPAGMLTPEARLEIRSSDGAPGIAGVVELGYSRHAESSEIASAGANLDARGSRYDVLAVDEITLPETTP